MDITAQILANTGAIAPELILIGTMLAVLLIDMVFFSRESSWKCGWVAMAGMALAGVLLLKTAPSDEAIFSGAIVRNSMALFFQRIIVLGAMAIVLFSLATQNLRGRRQGEYYGLLIAATVGAVFLSAANDFIILLLSLETLSLSSYVLSGYLRNDRESAEASIKYILYGAVASGIMLFGMTYLYGLTGSLKLQQIFAPLVGGSTPMVFYVALVMLLAGIGFKISAVPFHNWTPDVYEGSPTPVTAFLAVVSKSAGFAVLIRVLMQAGTAIGGGETLALAAERLQSIGFDVLVWILAAATMTVGNLVALRQTNIKRLLGYSSIAHAGYLLMAFAVLTPSALDAALFYFVVYYLMTLGAFLVAISLENHLGSSEMSACRGLWVSAPYMVAAMVIFMVALTGLPPTAGFIGKFRLFMAVVNAGLGEGVRGPWFYFSLALIGVANSVLALYYYFKIIKAMALESFDKVPVARMRLMESVPMAVLAIAVIVLGLYFTPLSQFVRTAFAAAPEAAKMISGF